MESVDNKEGMKYADSKFNQEIHSKVVRAGKRTYFFDVKTTRNDEYYLTITESKKRFSDNGKVQFEKHKIFLYKEDFGKFIESLQEIVDFIQEKQPMAESSQGESPSDDDTGELVNYTNLDFEDI